MESFPSALEHSLPHSLIDVRHPAAPVSLRCVRRGELVQGQHRVQQGDCVRGGAPRRGCAQGHPEGVQEEDGAVAREEVLR